MSIQNIVTDNPYETSQVSGPTVIDLNDEKVSTAIGHDALSVADGARNCFWATVVHDTVGLFALLMFFIDRSLGYRTNFLFVGQLPMLVAIVATLFAFAAGLVGLRLIADSGARMWFRAAFLLYLPMMALAVVELVCSGNYALTRDETSGMMLDWIQPALIVLRGVIAVLIGAAFFRFGVAAFRFDVKLAGILAAVCSIPLAIAMQTLGYRGNAARVVRYIVSSEAWENAAIGIPWLIVNGTLLFGFMRIWRLAERNVAPPVAIDADDPLSD